MAIFGNFQNGLIFQILPVFSSGFLHRTTRLFIIFLAFLIFDPKWGFCKGYSLCLVAIFGNFQNGLIFRILAVFSNRFLHRRTAMCYRMVFRMFFFSFLAFEPKLGFCKSYSFYLVAIFGNFQNGLIFRKFWKHARITFRYRDKRFILEIESLFSYVWCYSDLDLK